jgi:hypothetical protein
MLRSDPRRARPDHSGQIRVRLSDRFPATWRRFGKHRGKHSRLTGSPALVRLLAGSSMVGAGKICRLGDIVGTRRRAVPELERRWSSSGPETGMARRRPSLLRHSHPWIGLQGDRSLIVKRGADQRWSCPGTTRRSSDSPLCRYLDANRDRRRQSRRLEPQRCERSLATLEEIVLCDVGAATVRC